MFCLDHAAGCANADPEVDGAGISPPGWRLQGLTAFRPQGASVNAVASVSSYGYSIAMFRGEKINKTEDRAVLHVALHLRRLRKVAALEAQAVSP